MVQIALDYDKLAAFCRKHRIQRLALFGSVLRPDFRPESDVDVLVRFAPDAHHGLFALVRMQNELAQILGRQIDLVEWEAVEQSRNYIRRREILRTLEPIYEG